ncbi:hypothetical protein [Paraburkholderia sp. RAU2J]|uniref:hypothetical protein n=1 Tax=Paraburkholderia sp. RAU2J TaxID=1938810 RepID=UPI0018F651A7|nr:hypothetical protein [Paraburkholderia sp. RAU2J]
MNDWIELSKKCRRPSIAARCCSSSVSSVWQNDVSSSLQPHVEPTPPTRTQREEFFIGDKVGFTDKHLSERVGVVVRLNAKTASVAVNNTVGHWRVSYSPLRKILDI